MNGIYFCEGINFNDKTNIGIVNKVKQQIDCLKSIGSLTVISTNYKESLFEKILFVLPICKSDRENKRKELIKQVNDNTDYIYIRKPSLTITFYKILNKIKKDNPKIIIILEIPTYPFHSEYKGISKVLNLKSIRCEKRLHNVVSRIATYSNDDQIWGIKTIKLSNCVNYANIKVRSNKYKTVNNTIRLTCVANFTYWHGMDRLIKGIDQYKGKYKITLNLVGSGTEIEKLKKISNNKNILFLGPKTGKELDEIFENTDIAVDALGRHRSGVLYNSSLKGKEYAARGIPEISAVLTEMDYINNYNYYLKLPSNDGPIEIETIVSFYEKHIKGKSNISGYIRNKTYKLFDYEYGYKSKIYNELKVLLDEN